MVVRVKSGKTIYGVLRYNESKVEQGKAACIQAHLFQRDTATLTFDQKHDRFTSLNERNRRSRTNTLHVSLNFDRSEKLSTDVLNNIAAVYVEKIGFGEQPFLVYEHTDAAHPHIHIVTTLIQENGKRIPIHLLGKNQSEMARKEIENRFGLVRADSRKKSMRETMVPAAVQKVVYGKSETRQSIIDVVRFVTRSFKYASLAELNAALRQFNVAADRGSEYSRMYEKKGLLYSTLDENGKQTGVPIKASAIPDKPTLAFLEKQFKLNEVLRSPYKNQIKESIDMVFGNSSVNSKDRFETALAKVDIAVVYRENAEGRTYGITFIDQRSRVVINGSDLGKGYSAAAILSQLHNRHPTALPMPHTYSNKPIHGPPAATGDVPQKMTDVNINELLLAKEVLSASPEAALKLGRRRRKKRRKL
jgi:hypothetical protein